MRALLGQTLTALASGRCALAQLVEMDLTSPWRVNTSAWDLSYQGNTYLGVAGVGRIDVIDDSPGELKGLRFELACINPGDIAIALAEPIQGKLVTLYTAIFDPDTYQIVEAVVEWQGRLDVMQIAESERSAIIQVSAEHIGIDLLRPSGLLYSNQDQQRLYPGDLSFEYVVDQSEQQIVFPAASYFRQ